MTTTEPAVRDALRQVIDPELGINIVDLGIVYGIEIEDDSRVRVVMTMTSPACPLDDYLKDLGDDGGGRRGVGGRQRSVVGRLRHLPRGVVGAGVSRADDRR
jgi:hypothetical protein